MHAGRKLKRGTLKSFRDYLNAKYPDAKHRHNRYKQLSRPYGDYLFFQDREQFDVLLAEALDGDEKFKDWNRS